MCGFTMNGSFILGSREAGVDREDTPYEFGPIDRGLQYHEPSERLNPYTYNTFLKYGRLTHLHALAL